jgi:hypothetical protein
VDAPPALTPRQESYLVCGADICGQLSDGLLWASFEDVFPGGVEQARELWSIHRGRLIDVERRWCRRPWAWWRFEHGRARPEAPRQNPDGSYYYSTPLDRYVEADELARMGELDAAELERLAFWKARALEVAESREQ